MLHASFTDFKFSRALREVAPSPLVRNQPPSASRSRTPRSMSLLRFDGATPGCQKNTPCKRTPSQGLRSCFKQGLFGACLLESWVYWGRSADRSSQPQAAHAGRGSNRANEACGDDNCAHDKQACGAIKDGRSWGISATLKIIGLLRSTKCCESCCLRRAIAEVSAQSSSHSRRYSRS
jgi:hypothetical protein